MAMAQQQRQKHTEGYLRNDSQHTLALKSSKVWEGDQRTKFPETILFRDVGEFTHDAGPNDGSVAGLAYQIADDGKKWIVAWSNPRGEDSKVYTDIVDGYIDWVQIKKELDDRGEPSYEAVRFGYRAAVVIDPKACSPVMTATIEPRI
ncbi:hypothetical protein HRI_002711900 [Hibiscus trionum]|uniref:Uncharacterized protein n=1 Tax=Hibiscus trionum TaxID=183268 RepID=A0A9W7M7K7_HIBTR|nr:hypothetical protein HRI_002711900 [Hibiscus trionum]